MAAKRLRWDSPDPRKPGTAVGNHTEWCIRGHYLEDTRNEHGACKACAAYRRRLLRAARSEHAVSADLRPA